MRRSFTKRAWSDPRTCRFERAKSPMTSCSLSSATASPRATGPSGLPNMASWTLWALKDGTIRCCGRCSREQVQRQKGAAIKKLTPEVVARAREESKQMGDVARKFIKAGMKLVFGSDNGAAGRGYGWYNQIEFESWIDMGFTPMEAIVMATRDAAEIGGFNTGLVAPGRSADFIVLDANPLEN